VSVAHAVFFSDESILFFTIGVFHNLASSASARLYCEKMQYWWRSGLGWKLKAIEKLEFSRSRHLMAAFTNKAHIWVFFGAQS